MLLQIDEKMFNEIVTQKEANRDETMKWPNSFGHGFSSGQVELLTELKECFKTTQTKPDFH